MKRAAESLHNGTSREPQRGASVPPSAGFANGSVLGLQRSAGNRAVLSLLSAPRVQAKSDCESCTHDPLEAEADRAAEAVTSGAAAPALSAASAGDDSIQPKCAACEEEEHAEKNSDPAPGGNTTTVATAPTPVSRETGVVEQTEQAARPDTRRTPAPGLIVDEATSDAPTGAMSKTEFLSVLRQSVCATVDAGAAGTGQSSAGCPWIAHWFDYYQDKSAGRLERALLKYAPEARNAASAHEYVSAVTARVKRSVVVWRETGEVTGLPEGVSPGLPGGFLGGLVAAAGGLFFKARHGGAKQVDPAAVRGRLGSGRSLDGSVRSRMESAFGASFAGVRVHTDSQASEASNDLNARAFTLGRDVAFGAGEYRPGTPTGDALIAHELAHVVQQGAAESAAPQAKGVTPESSALELDADNAAVAATASLWGRAITGAKGLSESAMPRLRSGLQLSRCKKTTKEECLPGPCKQPIKTVSVDLIKLHGSTMTPATDLAVAKKAYKPCCIDIVPGKQETVSQVDTHSWIGADQTLAAAGVCTPTGEEKAVMANAQTKYGISADIHAFYVEDTTHNSRAYTCGPGASTYFESVWITNSAKPRSLAHEIGHILIDTFDHKGICHPEAKDNVMTPSNSATGQVLDKDQCKKAYGNA